MDKETTITGGLVNRQKSMIQTNGGNNYMFATKTVTKIDTYQTRVNIRIALIEQLVNIFILNTADKEDVEESSAKNIFNKLKFDIEHSSRIVITGLNSLRESEFTAASTEDLIKLLAIAWENDLAIVKPLKHGFVAKDGINIIIDPDGTDEELY